MPTIVGSNADEGATLTATWPMRTPAELRTLAETNFPQAKEANALYPAARDDEVRGRVAEMFADTQFNYGVWQVGAGHVGPRAAWRYLFLRRRAPPRWAEPWRRVSYVFNTLGLALAGQEVPPFDGVDESVAEAMQAPGCGFAATGDPNGGELPHCRLIGRTTIHISRSTMRSAQAATGDAGRWIFSTATMHA
jgi:carboxylesterase type B